MEILEGIRDRSQEVDMADLILLFREKREISFSSLKLSH